MAETRAHLASYLGTAADNLVFVPNATTAINIVAQTLDLAENDEVLTTDLEYGAMDRTWDKVCRVTGCRYIRRPVQLPLDSPDAFVEHIWNGVTDRTRVLFLSHITSSTAITFPVKPLIDRARAAGILTVIDGAHVPGQIDLDLDGLGADFYTGNCHKWMMTPKGCAFLFARPEVQDLIGPLVVSWGDDSNPGTPFIHELEFVGTNDPAAYLSVPASIEFMQRYNWPQVRRNCHEIVRYYRNEMTKLTGISPIVPDSTDFFAQMSAHPLPACDGLRLKQRLYDEYKIEIPITEVAGSNYIRVSIQGYNEIADVDRLLAALQTLLKEPDIV